MLSAVEDPRPHRCGRCMNPFTRDGNPACPNARPSQTVPYEEEPLPIPPSPHTRWWPDEPDAA